MLIPCRLAYYSFLPFLVFSCSQRGFDSAAEGQKLLRRDAEWADLAAAGKDVDKVVSYWTDDAVLIFPGQPIIEGKAAIRAYVAVVLSVIPVSRSIGNRSKVTFSPDGKLAYMRRDGRRDDGARSERHADDACT